MRKNAKRVSAIRTQAGPARAQVGLSTSNPTQTEVSAANSEKPNSSEPEKRKPTSGMNKTAYCM